MPGIRNETQPNILIAGCGTGRHPIETSSRFANSKVVALDSSSNSLSYAIRKARELDVSNIDFFQGDILNIDNLNQNFDIIESVGVLHHMMHPLDGWSMLCDKLKKGGLMKIGLYSELARRDITKIRQEIKDLRITSEIENIREFRSQIKSSSESHHRKIADFADFYTLSEFRDLVFHVQEHCFKIEQIQESLKKLGLVFCGFESDAIISSFKLVNPDPGSIYDLKLWSDFEAKNPDTFSGMYQFWCQKA